MEQPVVYRMMDHDASGVRHYQTLVGKYVELLSDLTQEHSLGEVRSDMKPLEDAVARLFPGLSLAGLGSPLESGSFFFAKYGQEEPFHYDVLSSGEKAGFDLLLDLFVSTGKVDDGLVCLDEPEAHLNPRVQADLAEEILRLVPPDVQVWVATHSIGFIRRAMDIHRSQPDDVVFLDLEGVEGDDGVVLAPSPVDRQFFVRTLETALDDLADLVGPKYLILCEGAPGTQDDSGANVAWDARILTEIFRDERPDVGFISVGSRSDLAPAAESFATAVAKGTQLLKVRDRDQLAEERVRNLMADDPFLRIWSRKSLESYLLDDAVLRGVVTRLGDRTGNALEKLRARRDETFSQAAIQGDAKPALGVVYSEARRELVDNAQLGENKWQFAVDVLAVTIRLDRLWGPLLNDLRLE